MNNLEQFASRGMKAQDSAQRVIDDVNAVNAWNTQHDVGTPVRVRKDDGSIVETITESIAWMVGGHTAVVKVRGITGGYLLSRVTPL